MKSKGTTIQILFKELLRMIKINIKQLISIIAISFLAICLFSGLTSNAYNLKERQDNLYNETNLADIYVNTTGLTEKDKTTISSYLNTNEKMEERIYLTCSVNNVSSYLISTSKESELSKPKIINGNEGFLVMDTFLSSNTLSIGDSVTVNIVNSFKTLLPETISFLGRDFSVKTLLSGAVKENKENIIYSDNLSLPYTITGSMYHPEGVQNSAFSKSVVVVQNKTLFDPIYSLIEDNYNISLLKLMFSFASSSFSITMSDKEFKKALFSYIDSFSNQIIIDATNSDLLLSKINNYFQELESSNFIIAIKSSSLPSYMALEQDVTQAMKLTFVFPIIFFLVSILVIMTTLSQIILRNRQQIGILKAIGVSKARIFIHYISFGVIVCLIGGILGFIAGPLIIPHVMSLKYNLLWDLPSTPISFFYPLSILLLVLLLLSAALCSFFLSLNVIREKPVDTLRPAIAKTKKRKGNKESFYSKHASIELKMSLRNIVKNKTKTILMVLGMLGCTSLLVCGFGITDTLNYDVNLDYNVNQYYDIGVVPMDSSKSLLDDLKGFDNVEKVDPISTNPITLSFTNSKDTKLLIIQKDAEYFNVPFNVDDGVTIDQTTAEAIGASLNDEVKILLNGNIYYRKITYIFTSSVLQGIYDLKDYYEENFLYTQYNITLKDRNSTNETKKKLSSLYNIKTISTHAEMEKQAKDLLSSIDRMTTVIKIFAILLCVVVIYNLTNLNIQERMRDIATLKVLGFHFKEISKTLTYELALDSFFGSFLGTFIGYPLTILVMAVNKTNLLTFIYHVNFTSYLFSFLLAFLVSLIISILLNLKAKRINMTESLKSIE